MKRNRLLSVVGASAFFPLLILLFLTVFSLMSGNTVRLNEAAAAEDICQTVAGDHYMWIAAYGDAAFEQAGDVVSLVDGGFGVAGSTNDTVVYPGSWVFKVEADSSPTWQKIHQIAGGGFGHIQQNVDKSVTVVGYSWTYETLLVARHGVDGSLIWKKHYGDRDAVPDLTAAAATTDDGVVLVGRNDGIPDRDWIWRLDENGDPVWQHYYDVGDFKAIDQTPDGGFIALSRENLSLLRLDKDGKVVWRRSYGGGQPGDVAAAADGTFMVVGYNVGTGRAFIFKAAEDGTPVWLKEYQVPDYEQVEFRDVEETTGGTFLIAGNVYDSDTYVSYGWAVEADGDGVLQWNRVYTFASSLFSIVEVGEQGLAAAGEGNGNALVLRLDDQGGYEGCAGIEGGGAFVYDYPVTGVAAAASPEVYTLTPSGSSYTFDGTASRTLVCSVSDPVWDEFGYLPLLRK